MTKDQAVEYLTIDKVMRQTDDSDRDATIIEFAQDRGFYVGFQWDFDVEYAIAKRDGVEDDEYFENYDGDGNVRDVAREAVEWLNDEGLLPQGYGYDDTRPGDGFGVVDTRGAGQ